MACKYKSCETVSEDVASGVKTRQEFLCGIAHIIRWTPVNGTVKHAPSVRFQNQAISPL